MIVLLGLAAMASQFKVDPKKKFILDKDGRTIIFHGVNVVYKLPPYIPKTDSFDPYYSLSDEDISYMKKMGFNLVRLGVIWESVEREEGKYDLEYLKKMSEIVNKLGENGIYSIVDAHQDCFSRNFCGEGVPYFYTEKIGYETQCSGSFISKVLGLVNVCKPLSQYDFGRDDKGLPLIEDCKKRSFVDYHFSPEMTSAYKSFYENKYDIQEKFAKFWQVVAKEFKGNKYVVGYDIWNEPFPGGLFDNLSLLWPNKADMEQIAPVYAKVDKAIREVDPDYISFFENMPFPDNLPLFGGLIVGKFTKTPADQKYPQVYNVHNYCCLSGPTVCNGPEPDLETAKTRCPKYHEKKVEKNIKDAEQLQVPLIISEFGACSDSLACLHEIWSVVRAAEKNLVSWAYWMYKPYGDFTTSAIALVDKEGIFNANGTIQYVKERSLSRAYVQYYQGEPESFGFTNEETDFETVFKYNAAVSAPTVIYFNENFHYKNGYSLKIVNTKTGAEVIFHEDKVENYITISGIDKSLNEVPLKIIFKAK